MAKLPAHLIFLLLLVSMTAFDFSPARAGDERAIVQDSTDWQEITSAQDVWNHFPEKMRRLMGALDLDRSGLTNVQRALDRGDTVAAGRSLLSYYRTAETTQWLRTTSRQQGGASEEAQRLLQDTFSFENATDRVPRQSHGGLQWDYLGPDRDKEFGYALNSHTYFQALLEAWQKTGDPAYAETFDRLVRDWIIHNPLPPEGDSLYMVHAPEHDLGWRDLATVQWRDLEAGQRLGRAWPQVFYGFQQSEAFTPAARLLMLAGVPEHAAYLRNYHREGHNWTTMEMQGLALAGLAFLEFGNARSWANYALAVMEEEIDRQVYPDGVQTELSAKTQRVTLEAFERFADTFRKAGRAVSPRYRHRVERMWNYLAYAIRPDGYGPMHNDADHTYDRSAVREAAATYDRPDWLWIATNGQQGERPDGLPSAVFPWAGFHIMRNGWNESAHWGFFDAGPFGTGHQHSDKLHLSVAAYGRDLLVDAGRYTHENYWSFDPATWRGYFRSSFSHNLLLVDGRGQYDGDAGPGDEESERTRAYKVADKPLQEGIDYVNEPAFDYARGVYNSGFEGAAGKAVHTRAVFYVRDRFWVVVDRLATDRPRRLKALWHYHPACAVVREEETVVSTDAGKGNLRIVPVGEVDWQVDLVRGQEAPYKQGWYSPAYQKKIPGTAGVFAGEVAGSSTFAWVLVPGRGDVPEVEARLVNPKGDIVQVEVEVSGKDSIEVIVPMRSGTPQKLFGKQQEAERDEML